MNIVLGVTGGIAAYKAPDLVRRLRERGAAVRVILTANAARFVSPLSLAAVSEHGVMLDQWGDPSTGGVDHIALARWAELLLIAPATANVIAKLATGIADDALTTYALAHRTTIAIAPAMNTFMLQHPTVTSNLETLRSRGVRVLEPDSGLLACGDEGAGRMPDPPVIAEWVQSLTRARDLEGKRLLITAGPTREPIDPVRFISNRSSGRMGYALAEAAAARGAKVTLVTGPAALTPPASATVIRVMSAQEMHDAVMANLDGQDAVIKAAAVADFSPAESSSTKIKKGDSAELVLRLQRAPDILQSIGALEKRPVVMAFAAETNNVEEHARQKLQRKRVDMIVANDVSDTSIGFDSMENRVTVISADGRSTPLEKGPKTQIAHRLLDLLREMLGEKS